MSISDRDIIGWLQNVYTDSDGVVTSVNSLDLDDSHELALTLIGLLDGMARTQELAVREMESEVYEGMPDHQRIAVYEKLIASPSTYLGMRGLNRLMRDVRKHGQ